MKMYNNTMRLNILCTAENIVEVRAAVDAVCPPANYSKYGKLFQNLPTQPTQSTNLSIPLSPSGSLPATHWYCLLNVEQDVADKVKSFSDKLVVEEAEPKAFLESHSLRQIW
jgi:hypothetical protein